MKQSYLPQKKVHGTGMPFMNASLLSIYFPISTDIFFSLVLQSATFVALQPQVTMSTSNTQPTGGLPSRSGRRLSFSESNLSALLRRTASTVSRLAVEAKPVVVKLSSNQVVNKRLPKEVKQLSLAQTQKTVKIKKKTASQLKILLVLLPEKAQHPKVSI